MIDSAFANEMATLKTKRILFAHQSVGENILGGLRELMKQAGVSELTIAKLDEANSIAGGVLAETAVGENMNPGSKCTDFSRVLRAASVQPFDIALVKFCYVDITATSNVDSVFTLYRQTVDSLRAVTQTKLVHVTVPLHRVTPAWKRIVKGILGRGDSTIQDNIRRNQFNDMIRNQYAGEPIFDLAMAEATAPDGGRVTFEEDGQAYMALYAEYTYDGGHLNALGSRTLAREFIRTLAAVK